MSNPEPAIIWVIVSQQPNRLTQVWGPYPTYKAAHVLAAELRERSAYDLGVSFSVCPVLSPVRARSA